MGRVASKTKSFGTPIREGHDSSSFYQRKLYQELRKGPAVGITPLQEKELVEVNKIYHHDSRDMNKLPDSSIHMMITSPPYNVGKEYDDDLSLAEYKELLHKVMKETHRVLVGGGRMCVNIANVGRSPYIPLHMYVIKIAEELGFHMRGEIIWDKGASAGTSCAWGSWKSASNPTLRDVHEYILVFSKATFNRHDKGCNTIGRDDFIACTKSVWRFSTEQAKRVKHPAPFPIELPRRLIELYSYEGDIILDPFMGSGTTAEAAILTKRKYVGYEVNKEYVFVALNRLNTQDT